MVLFLLGLFGLAGCKARKKISETAEQQIIAHQDCSLVEISEEKIKALPTETETDSLQIIIGNGQNGAAIGQIVPRQTVKRGNRSTLQTQITSTGKLLINCQCDSVKAALIKLQKHIQSSNSSSETVKKTERLESKPETGNFWLNFKWGLFVLLFLLAVIFLFSKRILTLNI